MFVDASPVAVTDDKGNTIYVRPKMGKGIQAQVSNDFQRLGGSSQVAYGYSLLAHNVVAWDGPDFVDGDGRAIPATRANIDRLDPDEPIVNQAIDTIAKLNTQKVSTAVPAAAKNGATPPDPMTAVSPI